MQYYLAIQGASEHKVKAYIVQCVLCRNARVQCVLLTQGASQHKVRACVVQCVLLEKSRSTGRCSNQIAISYRISWGKTRQAY